MKEVKITAIEKQNRSKHLKLEGMELDKRLAEFKVKKDTTVKIKDFIGRLTAGEEEAILQYEMAIEKLCECGADFKIIEKIKEIIDDEKDHLLILKSLSLGKSAKGID